MNTPAHQDAGELAPPRDRRWFDGHLDLTYLALHGRDLNKPATECGGSLQPASVTFPTLRAAGVRAIISTLFVRRRGESIDGPFCFSNPEEAFTAASKQVDMHRQWQRDGHLRLQTSRETEPADILQATLAMEGAAALRRVEDIDHFHQAGVRMVSLAWAEGSPWAGGDQAAAGADDITPDGRALIRRLDELRIVHDVSHLSERAFWSLLELATGPVVASHSNCRALLPGAKSPQRHLSDDQIRALAARGGKIGINLFARFLLPPDELKQRRATAQDVVRHIAHVEQVASRRGLCALGSDMDSGFGTDLLPEDLEGPTQLPRLAEALSQAGWADPEIAQFAWGWASEPGL